MENRETIERNFKLFLKISSLIIFFITLICMYEYERWREHKDLIKEEIPNAHKDMIYVMEYKYFSFKEMCWIYRICTPTSNPIQYYEWNKKKNTLTLIDKKKL